MIRFSVSVEEELFERFNTYISESGYPTRSEAVKVLMNRALTDKDRQKGGMIAGTITLVYDHHGSNLVNKLLEYQHDFGSGILVSQHVHLDHRNCLEVLVVRGQIADLEYLVNRLRSIKGLQHCELTVATSAIG